MTFFDKVRVLFMTFFVEICISKIFASIDNCSSLWSHFLKIWNSHIIIVFLILINVFMSAFNHVVLLILYFKSICNGRYFLLRTEFKFSILESNQFVTVDISSSERSFNSQYWKLWYHYCFFFPDKRVHEGF